MYVRTVFSIGRQLAPFEVLEAVDSRPSFPIRRRFDVLSTVASIVPVWGAPAKLPLGVSLLRGTRVS